MLAAQAQDGGAHRAAHVEGKDARIGIAAELHRQGGEQHGLAHAGRSNDKGVADIADVRHQPERCRAIGTRDDQGRSVEVRVPLRPGPHCRYRHQMREVQRRDDRLAHIRIGVARNRRQPRLHGVERFRDRDETSALDDALDHAQLLVGRAGIGVEYGHGSGDITEGDLVAAKLLQGRIGIHRLVRCVRINQRAFLLEDRLAQQRRDVLALGEPLAAQAAEFLFRLGLVHAQEARAPAIGEAESVQVIEQPRPGRGREAAHRGHAQVRIAQHRRQPAGQRAVGQQRIEVERMFWHGHAITPRGDGGVQVGQRLAVVEPGNLRHHAVEQVEATIRLRDEGRQAFMPIHATLRRVLVQ